VLPDDGVPAFVPVLSGEARQQASEPAQDLRSAAIELMIGAVTVRVPAGAKAPAAGHLSMSRWPPFKTIKDDLQLCPIHHQLEQRTLSGFCCSP
jgi:hypothetical protein